MNFDIFKSAVFGAVSVCKDESGVISFSRFTQKQHKFAENDDRFAVRCIATSGMCIDFSTNSDSISFDYEMFIASTRQFGFIDVLCDGNIIGHFGEKNVTKTVGTAKLLLPLGNKHIQIYLPCLFGAKLSNFSLSEGATFVPAKKERHILFLGDSITQGYVSEFPSLTYTNILSRQLKADSLNQAIGGEVFRAERFDDELEFCADTVCIAYGTNDWCHDWDIEKNSYEYFKKVSAKYPDSKIFAILPIWRADIEKLVLENPSKMPFEAAREIIRKNAAEFGITPIDGLDFLPHFPEFFQDEYLHPNEIGYRFYADALYEYIK